ncbi:MAG: hypothetical protein KIT00_03285 [Rhodospirillales bacterium]|nr:hypothetical protein [Rhodospirillales bacterium]
MEAQTAKALTELAQDMLRDDEAVWSVGTVGAACEFHRVDGEPVSFVRQDTAGATIVTPRGALRFAVPVGARAVAYEQLSAKPNTWRQSIAFCLRDRAAALANRTGITEIGPDGNALRSGDCEKPMFDLGIGVPFADFCVRTDDPSLLRILRRGEGRSILTGESGELDAIKAANPDRVCLTAVARIEVFQPIIADADAQPAPRGPRAYLSPEQLANGRAHAVDVPIPDGWVPVLTVHTGSPVIDADGCPRAVDVDRYKAFQHLLEHYAPRGYMEEKLLITSAVVSGLEPASYPVADEPGPRHAARIALRQLFHTRPDVPNLDAWLEEFDGDRGRVHSHSV